MFLSNRDRRVNAGTPSVDSEAKIQINSMDVLKKRVQRLERGLETLREFKSNILNLCEERES